MTNSHRYKTFASRFVALSTDGLLILAFLFFENILVSVQNSQALAVGGMILSTFCVSFYSFYLHGIYGQTVGKMLAKVKVLNTDEKPINFYIAFLRELPYILIAAVFLIIDIYEIATTGNRINFGETTAHNVAYVVFLIWLAAEIIVTLTDDKRRSIHDRIAGTVVVNLTESEL